MTYEQAKKDTFGRGYHVAFYSNEPCEYALIDRKIVAVHDSGMCWTGLVALTIQEAVWTLDHNQFWKLGKA